MLPRENNKGDLSSTSCEPTAKTDQVFTLLQDHLGGTNQVVNSSGTATQMRYGVWGAARDSLSSLPTSRLYTGQEKSNTGLYYFNARWYDSELGRFVQPDTIIPNQYNPVTLDRYAYSNNNPINFNDPNGHDPVPIDPNQIVREAVQFLRSIGQTIVDDPTAKSIYCNGVDIVSQTINEAGDVTETLLTEVKQTAVVTKGTLGLDKAGNLGGSIDRALRTANRLKNTSNSQLQAEFNAIAQGDALGNLKNALYTTAGKVNEGAKNAFNYVYMAAANGAVTTVKTVETIVTSTIDIPFLAVPFILIDPRNSPLYNPQIPQ